MTLTCCRTMMLLIAILYTASLQIGARRIAPGAMPPTVVVTAREYAFDAPDSVAAGPTTIRLVSRGEKQHFVGFVRIASPHTLAEYERSLRTAEATPWITRIGGVGTIQPGGEATTTIDLAPGLYALLCDMQDAKGTPHMLEGMLHPLRVTRIRNGATMPVADVALDLSEFAFSLHQALRAGPHVIAVRNVGTQPHMALLWKLHRGKTAADVVHWLNDLTDTGPPPVTLAGGVPDLDPGQSAEIRARLTRGRYLLICLVGDDHREKEKAHYERGMVREITVGRDGGSFTP